ncbi:flagellar biosynthetic protein FliO [Parerythrobacter jejuensis]|uniref:Flagellar biogenesis protein n=1 Tax=Parerythrobacter jejuensis TaxID=795812 RepID=A0A845AK32_9SPHN|nr:flagellar biosynthetic protein FliO [Parerythrobacter jejuensis]MXP30620.1 flagellar biogenesis protein [Parerythrobacter jejuensis]MXP33380.1 flagellar biogenesis protein [Parerythrobacter jejuensis]
MLWYFAKMALLLPLLGLLIWGSLALTKRMQQRLNGTGKDTRSVRLVETCFLGPGMKVAVVEFRGREILLGCTRQGLIRLGDSQLTSAPPAGDQP